MLTHEALTGLREYLMNRIAYAQYTVSGRVQTARIESAAIVGDGRISVSVILDPAQAPDEVVTDISLYDADGVQLAHKAENIVQEPSMGGIYYRFFFLIEEIE